MLIKFGVGLRCAALVHGPIIRGRQTGTVMNFWLYVAGFRARYATARICALINDSSNWYRVLLYKQ